MTLEELKPYLEEHNDGTLWVRVGPKTFTKLQGSLERRYRNEGENWFEFDGIRVICPDRRALRVHQDRLALTHFGNVISGYGWGIEE